MSKKWIMKLKVSAFIFTGLVLLGTFLIVIGNHQSIFTPTNEYSILIDNARGIYKGSRVTLNGMRAGHARKVHFEGDQIQITFSIRKNLVHMINASSIVKLKTEGVLGDRYIAVETLKEAPQLPSGSLIPIEKETSFLQMLEKSGNLTEHLSVLLKEAGILLAKINTNEKGDLGFLQELDTISKQAQKLLSDENNKELKEILKHAKSILRKIDHGDGTLGSLVNDQTLHKKAVSFLGEKAYTKIFKSIFSGGGSSSETPEPQYEEDEE